MPFMLAAQPWLGDNLAMPRSARAAVGGYGYHVIDWGNRRAEVFQHAFVRLIRQACARVPMEDGDVSWASKIDPDGNAEPPATTWPPSIARDQSDRAGRLVVGRPCVRRTQRPGGTRQTNCPEKRSAPAVG